MQAECLQCFQHQAACGQRLDARCILNNVQNTTFAPGALGHRGVGAVKHDEIRCHIREQLCCGGDLFLHHRERALPFAGNAGARNVHPETGRCKMIKLRLGHAVDRGDDHSDPRSRRR